MPNLIKILLTAFLLLSLAGAASAQQKQETATKKPTTQKKQTPKKKQTDSKKQTQKPKSSVKKQATKKKTLREPQGLAAKKKKPQEKKQELAVITPGRICSDTLISFAKKFLGTHYKYANCSPESGFDCSGFVYYVFGQFGVKVPRSSIDYGSLEPTVPKDSAKVGDIIVFTGTNAANRNAGHVGIVISNPGEEFTFIQSSSGKKRNGVIVSTFNSSPYYEKRFIKIVRLNNVTIEACTPQ